MNRIIIECFRCGEYIYSVGDVKKDIEEHDKECKELKFLQNNTSKNKYDNFIVDKIWFNGGY